MKFIMCLIISHPNLIIRGSFSEGINKLFFVFVFSYFYLVRRFKIVLIFWIILSKYKIFVYFFYSSLSLIEQRRNLYSAISFNIEDPFSIIIYFDLYKIFPLLLIALFKPSEEANRASALLFLYPFYFSIQRSLKQINV